MGLLTASVHWPRTPSPTLKTKTKANKPEARLLVLAWLLLDKPGQTVQALYQGTPLLISHVLFLLQRCVHEAPEGNPQQPMHPPHLQIRPVSGDTLCLPGMHHRGRGGALRGKATHRGKGVWEPEEL